MLWHKVDYQLKLHDISLIVGANRTEKTKFLLEQYGDTPFTLDVSKAKIAYCGGDTTITEQEWQQMAERDCPFIAVDDTHLLKPEDMLKLIDMAVSCKNASILLVTTPFHPTYLPFLVMHAVMNCRWSSWYANARRGVCLDTGGFSVIPQPIKSPADAGL